MSNKVRIFIFRCEIKDIRWFDVNSLPANKADQVKFIKYNKCFYAGCVNQYEF